MMWIAPHNTIECGGHGKVPNAFQFAEDIPFFSQVGGDKNNNFNANDGQENGDGCFPSDPRMKGALYV